LIYKIIHLELMRTSYIKIISAIWIKRHSFETSFTVFIHISYMNKTYLHLYTLNLHKTFIFIEPFGYFCYMISFKNIFSYSLQLIFLAWTIFVYGTGISSCPEREFQDFPRCRRPTHYDLNKNVIRCAIVHAIHSSKTIFLNQQ